MHEKEATAPSVGDAGAHHTPRPWALLSPGPLGEDRASRGVPRRKRGARALPSLNTLEHRAPAPPALHLDFECYCEADIRKVGLDNYIQHPSFVVTVIAWAFGDGPVQSVAWTATQDLPEAISEHVRLGRTIKAWNASFEHAILSGHYHCTPEVGQMDCVMQRALEYGLPAGLLKAGRALGLSTLKDEGKRLLMLSMGRPRRGSPPWHATDATRLRELTLYCEDDVRAERAIDKAVPALHPFEKLLSELDHEINQRGVMLDRDAIQALRAAAQHALAEINAECFTATQGEVSQPGSQVARLLAWLSKEGCVLESVDKEAVEAALNGEHPPHIRRVLELRRQAAKSSVAKLERMLDVMSVGDHRARYLLQFAGAGRTLRWAGRLIQPQNLPRSGGVNSGQLIDAATIDPTAPGLLWGSAMDAISRSLRACFISQGAHVLVSVDLAQIEARVLAWLAGQVDVLDAFSRGEDVYVLAADKVGSSDRQLGKVLTLACGYGMGAVKFRETAAKAPYYIELSAYQAQTHLTTWRASNGAITGFWEAVERAARLSVQHPRQVFDLPHGMAVRSAGGVTQVKKPNGVKLTYHAMRIWQGQLVFDGVNGVTKNWGVEKAYGGRLVENLVQSVARDIMAEAMLRVGLFPVMTVHDEIVWEVPAEGGIVQALQRVVETRPPWAAGLPIGSDVHTGVRYAK